MIQALTLAMPCQVLHGSPKNCLLQAILGLNCLLVALQHAAPAQVVAKVFGRSPVVARP